MARLCLDPVTADKVVELGGLEVLYPLAEIAPALKMPDGTALETLLQNCPRGDLQALPFFIQQPGAQTDLTPPG